MARDIYLDLGATIKGESKDAVYLDKIDILEFEWSLSQAATAHAGGGGGAGKVNFENTTIMKYVDFATPNLMMHCAKGNHFPEGKLVVRKAGGKQLEYLVIKMENMFVSNYSTHSSEDSEKLVEYVEYAPQKDDGSGDATVTFGWDIKANMEA